MGPLNTTLSKQRAANHAQTQSTFASLLLRRKDRQEWSPIPSSHPLLKAGQVACVQKSVCVLACDDQESAGMRTWSMGDKHHKQPKSSDGLSNLSLSRTVPRKAPITAQNFTAQLFQNNRGWLSHWRQNSSDSKITALQHFGKIQSTVETTMRVDNSVGCNVHPHRAFPLVIRVRADTAAGTELLPMEESECFGSEPFE